MEQILDHDCWISSTSVMLTTVILSKQTCTLKTKSLLIIFLLFCLILMQRSSLGVVAFRTDCHILIKLV